MASKESNPYDVYNQQRPPLVTNNSGGPVYNPYSFTSTREEQQAEEDYRDDPFVPPMNDPSSLPRSASRLSKARSPPPAAAIPRDSSSGAVRSFRQAQHGKLWNKGSRGRCFGRFFCCTVLTILVLLVSVVLTLGLWLRPPNVEFNGINFQNPADPVNLNNGAFSIPVTLNISVDNPNYIGFTFTNISAVTTYPGTNISVGGGFQTDVKFPAFTTSFLNFPMDIEYTLSNDPNFVILKDLASRCNGSNGQLTVNYVLKLSIRILALISPSFSLSATFTCPLTPQQIEGLAPSLLGGGR